MTKEEAIKGLKENLCSLCAYGSQNMDSCDIRGCDNRDYIKALEQQPSEDCVSRQAVIEIIKKSDACLYEKSDNDGLIEEIKTLSPVTPTHCIAAVRFSKEDLKNICDERIEIELTHGTCKDCRHREGIDLDACFCAKHGNSAKDDFYCKDFEMRGNENGTDNILSMR